MDKKDLSIIQFEFDIVANELRRLRKRCKLAGLGLVCGGIGTILLWGWQRGQDKRIEYLKREIEELIKKE